MSLYWIASVLMLLAVILLVLTSWLDAKARAFEKAFKEQQLAMACQQTALANTQPVTRPHTVNRVGETYRSAA